MKRNRFFLALALGVFTLGACAPRATQEPPVQGPEFILEIHNPQTTAMNLQFSMGGGGTLTTLGSIAPNETKRWSIPNRGGDRIVLVATDQNGGNRKDTSLDLEGGAVRRWEIK